MQNVPHRQNNQIVLKSPNPSFGNEPRHLTTSRNRKNQWAKSKNRFGIVCTTRTGEASLKGINHASSHEFDICLFSTDNLNTCSPDSIPTNRVHQRNPTYAPSQSKRNRGSCPSKQENQEEEEEEEEEETENPIYQVNRHNMKNMKRNKKI
jgi:hypothetical protein